MLCLWVWTEGSRWSGCRRGRQRHSGQRVSGGGVYPISHRWEGSSCEHRQVRKGNHQPGWVQVLADPPWEVLALCQTHLVRLLTNSFFTATPTLMTRVSSQRSSSSSTWSFLWVSNPRLGTERFRSSTCYPYRRSVCLTAAEPGAQGHLVTLWHLVSISGQGAGGLRRLQAQLGYGGARLPDQTLLPGARHRCGGVRCSRP